MDSGGTRSSVSSALRFSPTASADHEALLSVVFSLMTMKKISYQSLLHFRMPVWAERQALYCISHL